MVDVMQTNEKLRNRAENIVMEATGVERSVARATICLLYTSCYLVLPQMRQLKKILSLTVQILRR